MALNKDILTAVPELSSLTDDQIKAIEILSKNDENNVMTPYSRNFHERLEETVLEASGIPKQGSEKSYEYARRALSELKKATDSAVAKTEYEKLQKELETVKSATPTNDVWKQKYEDAEKQAKKLQSDLQKAETQRLKELHNVKVEYAINSAVSSLKFNTTVPEELRNLAKKSAIDKLKGYKADIDTEDPNKIIFRDEKGEILTNAKNYQNPYTVSELLVDELDKYGVIDKGRADIKGGGTKPVNKEEPTSTVISIAGATNKVEALNAIKESLAAQGIRKDSPQWGQAVQKAYQENKVSELPDGAE